MVGLIASVDLATHWGDTGFIEIEDEIIIVFVAHSQIFEEEWSALSWLSGNLDNNLLGGGTDILRGNHLNKNHVIFTWYTDSRNDV